MQSIPLSMGVENLSDRTSDSNSRRNSFSSEYAIKVRKPYTISKQRERWTDEEHDKFLEALKLYGRSWRKLEEHIGTKTAVQIRSHAQKFFAKVARESKGDNSYETEAVEIPPPRPKKKPLCPYPRKLENIPNIRVEVKENMPPTSVISTDTFNASASSHVSCVNQSELLKKVLSEDGCLSDITSAEHESKSDSLNKPDMDVDLITGDSTAGKETSSLEGSASNLKLFGKTLVVSKPCKSPYTTEESEINSGVYMWPNITAPYFYLLPPPQGVFPMWGLYCDPNLLATQAQMVFSSEGESASCAENLDKSAPNFELGIDGKNMNSGTGSKACKFRQSETSAFRRLKTSPKKTECRGFMPYKGCLLAEREVSHKIVDDIGGELEVQMCL